MARSSEPHVPGEAGIWVLVLGDMAVFGLMFGTYLTYRADAPEIFNQAQQALNRNLGALNTILLLTSSWLVAQAVQHAKRGHGAPIPSLLGSAILCALGFIVVKLFEYHEKIAAGITLTTNDFFMFYFVLTGIHLLHLVLGTCFLTFLWSRSRRSDWGQGDIALIEVGATFWHLVDLLWIVIFPLLYLVR